jgi:cytidylate kinase
MSGYHHIEVSGRRRRGGRPHGRQGTAVSLRGPGDHHQGRRRGRGIAGGSSTPDPVGWSTYAALPSHASPAYEGLFERVIRETANRGDVVIVAHGASIPLADTSGLLRVLVTASPRVRAERLAGEANLKASEARKAIAESDRQRREYLRRFYNVRQELPTHYDLVVNTDVLTLPQAAQLVVSAAKGQQLAKRV